MNVLKLKMNIVSRKRLIQFLFVSTIMLIFSYVYMVNMIAFDTAKKGNLVEQISVVNSEVGILELSIIEKKKDINEELAMEMGLVQKIENKTTFVLRGENTRLTFNE